MQLNDEQMLWVEKLAKTAKVQVAKESRDAQKTVLLDKLAEQREKNFPQILEGMQIKVGRPVGKKGKLETQDVYREDLDPTESYDATEERDGYRVTTKDGKKIEGALTEKWEQGQELIEQPEFEKFSKARHLLLQMTDEVHSAKVDVKKKGKTVQEPLFSDEELMTEVYDPMVRRGVPETFIGDDHSRTKKMIKGTFEEYAKRLEKEDLKGFFAENKDLGISVFRMCIALPGNVMASDNATHLLASQQQTTSVDPAHVFQQNFGMVKNDSLAGAGKGELADNLQMAVQSWAFIQNVSDMVFDGVVEGVKTGGELTGGKDKDDEDEEGEGHEKPKHDRAKVAPMLTQALVSAMALNVGTALSKLGPAGSTIFASVIKRSEITTLLAKKDVQGADITAVIKIFGDGIGATLDKLAPDNVDRKEIDTAIDSAKKALGKIKPDEVVKALKGGKLEEVVSAFNVGAQAASSRLQAKLGKFVATNAAAMKLKASDFVTEALKDTSEESNKPEDDDTHKQKHGHEPDWVDMKGKPICLRCKSDTKDVDLFAGILEQKITQLKKEEAFFKMAVNLGGMAFDVAANFIAPLAAGGALLRMSKFIFQAVKRWIDFANFCSSNTAMMNAASAYSPAVRRFRDDSGIQGMHYSINAACEGVKIVGACLQCSPAVIGGIIAAQAASGVEAVEAVLYEIGKRYQLHDAWQTYKVALNNPDNRKLALIAVRKNPTLAKYAIAWGAVIEEDPLVGDFMSYAGVNADTIRGNAKIDKVVEYLEARMPDDITVVGRRYETNADWAPSKVQLTIDSWLDAKTRGETQGGVAKVDAPAIESALTKYEAAREKMKAAKDESRKSREAKTNAAIASLRQARAAIQAYFPKDAKNGGRSEDMWEVVLLFLSQADIEMTSLESTLQDIKNEKPAVLTRQKRIPLPKKVAVASGGGGSK